MGLFLDYVRSTDLYRQLCELPATGEGNLLERTDDTTAEAQAEFLRWALALARPTVLLETGTNKGLFAYLVSLLLEGVKIHTLDVVPAAGRAVALLNERQDRVRCVFHAGDSRVTLPTLAIRPQFAWLDGGHATDVALSDLRQCHRLGVPYVAVDDTAYPSVWQAVEQALAELPYELVPNPYARHDSRGAVLLRKRPPPPAEADDGCTPNGSKFAEPPGPDGTTAQMP
jgi:hypothetical protein